MVHHAPLNIAPSPSPVPPSSHSHRFPPACSWNPKCSCYSSAVIGGWFPWSPESNKIRFSLMLLTWECPPITASSPALWNVLFFPHTLRQFDPAPWAFAQDIFSRPDTFPWALPILRVLS